MSDRVVPVGIVGAGGFGREHARAYATVPGAKLVSVVDTDPERAAALAADYDVEPGVPEAVSIVVPVAARGNLVLDHIAAGRAVLIEKPLARTAADTVALLDAARGRPVMVGHVLRFTDPYVRLEETARRADPLTGGSLSRIRSAAHLDRYPHDDIVGLTMIHDLDAAPWLAGSTVVAVSATGTQQGDRWNSCDAELVMADGTTWHVHALWEGSDAEQVDRASIRSASGEHHEITITAADTVYDAALDAELAHFVDHARSRTPSDRLRMADAAAAVALTDAVRLSLAQKGALVDV